MDKSWFRLTALLGVGWALGSCDLVESLGDYDKASPPTISPPGGHFEDPVVVTLGAANPEAAIHYTLDGSDPTEASPRYEEPLLVAASARLLARTWVPGVDNSAPAVADFLIDRSPEAEILRPTGDRTYYLGDYITFEAEAFDPDETQGLEFRWSGPGGSPQGRGALWTSSARAWGLGTHEFELTVTDSQGVATKRVGTLTVAEGGGGVHIEF